MRLQKRNRRHKWKHTDDSHIWHCLTSPNIRRKIRRCDCLHGTFSMWFWVRLFNRMHVCAFFLFGVFAVCLLRDYGLNWVQILMGLMCHLFIFCVLDFLTEKKEANCTPPSEWLSSALMVVQQFWICDSMKWGVPNTVESNQQND